jgi:hypothetical protein
MQAKGDYLGRVHSDQMVLEKVTQDAEWRVAVAKSNSMGAIRLESTNIRYFFDDQAGKPDQTSSCQKTLKTKLNLKGDICSWLIYYS